MTAGLNTVRGRFDPVEVASDERGFVVHHAPIGFAVELHFALCSAWAAFNLARA